MPLDQWLAVRRRHGRWLWVMLGAGIVLSAMCSWMAAKSPAVVIDGRTMRIVRIVDGVTVELAADPPARGAAAVPVTVSLLGVNRPARDDPSAAPWLHETTHGLPVTVIFDRSLRGMASPDIQASAYLYLPDGRMLNEMMIEQGRCLADRSFPHELRDWFVRLEGRAAVRRRRNVDVPGR